MYSNSESIHFINVFLRLSTPHCPQFSLTVNINLLWKLRIYCCKTRYFTDVTGTESKIISPCISLNKRHIENASNKCYRSYSKPCARNSTVLHLRFLQGRCYSGYSIRVKITPARATFAQNPRYRNFNTVLNVCVLNPIIH
jgi:hypothetical protein